MIRHLDLIRDLLLIIETEDEFELWELVNLGEYTFEEITHHLGMICSEGYAVRASLEGNANYRLTSSGKKFLESARDFTVWISAKKFVLENYVSASLDVVKTVLQHKQNDRLRC